MGKNPVRKRHNFFGPGKSENPSPFDSSGRGVVPRPARLFQPQWIDRKTRLSLKKPVQMG
jgi:hypothetical protein